MDDKRFWKIAKLLLSNKVKSSEKNTVVHKDKIITNSDENAKIFFFCNVVKHLKITGSKILIVKL